MGKQLEGQRRGNVVRDVGHAKVKVWEVHPKNITLDDLQHQGKRGGGSRPGSSAMKVQVRVETWGSRRREDNDKPREAP